MRSPTCTRTASIPPPPEVAILIPRISQSLGKANIVNPPDAPLPTFFDYPKSHTQRERGRISPIKPKNLPNEDVSDAPSAVIARQMLAARGISLSPIGNYL